MSNCNPPTCSQNYDASCESMDCVFNVDAVNIDKLFKRTDDLKNFYEESYQKIIDSEVIIANHEERISDVEEATAGLSRAISYVETEAQLLEEITAGKIVVIKGSIVLTNTLVLSLDGTTLIGYNKSSKLIFPHNTISARSVILVQAKNISIVNLGITTNHPLYSNTNVLDIGIQLSTGNQDISGLFVDQCRIHNVIYGIRRTSSNTSAYADNVTISRNYIFNVGGYGIDFWWKVRNVKILNNRFEGRLNGETHAQVGNAIWLGNYADYAQIKDNEIRAFGRHAIEYWNSQDSPENINGNLNAIISGNIIYEMLNSPGDSFGISAFGNGVIRITNNTVKDCTLGIETYGDKTNLGFIQCINNSVQNWRSNGITINGVRGGGLISDNYVGQPSTLLTSNTTNGIMVCFGGSNITISNNRLEDAGMSNILVKAQFLKITNVTLAIDGVFTATNALGSPFSASINNGFGVGKRIYIQEVSGMTQLNNKYYTITELIGLDLTDPNNPTATGFKLGVNTSGFTPFVNNGLARAIERFDGITINDNVIKRTKLSGIPGNSDFRSPIWIQSSQEIVVRNNVSYTPGSIIYTGPNFGTFAISSYGKAYIGPDVTSTVSVNSDTALAALLGTNMEIATVDQ